MQHEEEIDVDIGQAATEWFTCFSPLYSLVDRSLAFHLGLPVVSVFVLLAISPLLHIWFSPAFLLLVTIIGAACYRVLWFRLPSLLIFTTAPLPGFTRPSHR